MRAAQDEGGTDESSSSIPDRYACSFPVISINATALILGLQAVSQQFVVA